MALQEPEIDEAEWYPVKDKFSVRRQISQRTRDFRVIQSGAADDVIIISFTGTSSFTAEEGTVSKEVSLEEFAALQRQMVELYPSLEGADISLLELPQPPRGLMSYIRSMHIPDKFFVDAAEYLNQLSNHCGVDNVLRVFLQLADDYEEQWDDLNRAFYAEEWKTAVQDYEQVVAKRTQLEFKSMEELHNYYEEEDESFFFLDRKERRHYKFQIRPFEDLCNIVSAKRDEAVVRLSDVNLPITELTEAMQEQAECQEHYLEARTQLQHIQLVHYQALAERIELRLRRVEEDKHCLSAIWDRKGDGRLIQLHDALNGVIVTMLKLHCQQLADQKEQALLSMAMVKEGPNMAQEVAQKEDEVFRIQLQHFNLQQRLLEEEETKLKYKLDFVGQEQKDKLKRKLSQIPTKMAQIRIKQRDCRAMLEERSKRVINVEESISAQLAFQMKEKFIKQDEQKRQEEFRASRQKTINRLRKYQECNVTPQKMLPPRYQPPSQRTGVKKKMIKIEATKEPLLPSMRTLEIASLVVSKQQLQPPPVPPPPNIDPLTEQFIAEQNATPALLPSFPPAPPPPPPPPPPGPIVQQKQQPQLVKDEKPQPSKTATTIPSQLAITTDIIINAKERLRKSSVTAKKGLSADNADFLREKINQKFTGTFSENNESDSSDDSWETQ